MQRRGGPRIILSMRRWVDRTRASNATAIVHETAPCNGAGATMPLNSRKRSFKEYPRRCDSGADGLELDGGVFPQPFSQQDGASVLPTRRIGPQDCVVADVEFHGSGEPRLLDEGKVDLKGGEFAVHAGNGAWHVQAN